MKVLTQLEFETPHYDVSLAPTQQHSTDTSFVYN